MTIASSFNTKATRAAGLGGDDILQSNSNESASPTRAKLALPCAACSHHDKDAFTPCFIAVHGPEEWFPCTAVSAHLTTFSWVVSHIEVSVT